MGWGPDRVSSRSSRCGSTAGGRCVLLVIVLEEAEGMVLVVVVAIILA